MQIDINTKRQRGKDSENVFQNDTRGEEHSNNNTEHNKDRVG